MNFSKRFATNVSIGDPIGYDSEYYIIKNIEYNEIKMPTKIEIGYISKKERKTEWINPNDIKIKIIDKKMHERIISYLKFLDRYNATIYYLLKKGRNYESLNTKNAEEDIQLYFGRCKLKMNDLNARSMYLGYLLFHWFYLFYRIRKVIHYYIHTEVEQTFFDLCEYLMF